MYTRTPKQQFQRHKASAKKREIEFLFDFDSWMLVWEMSGKFDQRGSGADQYVMARNGDIGPYSAENVKIIKMRENCSEAHSNKPKRSFAELSGYSLGKGRGWTKTKAGYQVTVSRKYIGLFKTQQEAESVYKNECAKKVLEAA